METRWSAVFFIHQYEADSINLDKRVFRDKLRQVRVAGGAAGLSVDIFFYCRPLLANTAQYLYNYYSTAKSDEKLKKQNFTASNSCSHAHRLIDLI